eukprot:XP_011683991.1 PREDICTED: uncharacterized protein LOC580510 [Strongylocentrotus purpuratus]
MPSSRERGQSGARERMSSIAKESVAKAKAMLNKRTSGCSSPKKSHRYDRRRSSKDLCLDGLTEWTKTESSHKETRSGELRKKERGHEGSERKRKHRLSSSFQKESLSHAKKRKAGSNSDDTGKVDIADENHLDAGGINSCTYEEGHTVLACGIRDSIECTSSKVTVLHTSVSDAYDTTQSDTSFLHASGLQVDNGALKQSTGDAVYHLNKEINEERELSEGEIVSDDEEASRTKKSKPKSSEKKKRRLSKHRHSHSKSPESTTHFLKPPRRGKKHKRRRSSDQEAQERKKRLKENMKSDDSIQSQTEENASVQTSKACEDGLVEELVSENAFPPLTGLNDSEIAPEHPDDDVDKEKDVSEFPETPVDNRPTPTSQSEAVGMMHVSESALGACGVIEEVSKTETLSSPVEEGEHEKDENRGERILKFEDAVESETVGANASTEALSEHAISTPIKESVCAGEIQARQGATEADPNVSRGILFEDLCLSSSMDDTSYLSCVNTTSENQRHSFMNSIEKVDDLVKEISDPLVNTSALDMDASQKPTEGHEKLETEISESLGKSALDLHHIPPKTITSEPMPDPSKNGERFSKLQVKNATHDQIVTDGTHLETSPDTSAELNTSKSSEPAQNDAVHSCEKEVLVLNEDKSKSDDHVADEDNDAVSLLAASGYLDSFMHDNAPKVKRHVDLSFDEVEESRGVLKETETVDKTETSLHLTCEWSNIEFQDSSTKMGAEPDQGPVTVVSPFFDDGCAQDMEYATNPMLDEEEHEENKEIFKGDKETEIDFGRTVGDNIKEKEKSQTYMPNEASELRPSKRDPLNLDNMDTSVSDALATEEAGIRTDGHQSCEVKVSGASYSTEKRHSPLSKAKATCGSRERSSTSKSDHDKRLSPSRSSRSRSNDKRSSRSKSSDRMLCGSRSSSGISHERRSSRSKSRDRTPHSKSRDKPNDLKQRKEEVSQRKSSSTSKSSRSARDARDKQAESLAFSKSITPRENVSKDRRRDRDRRESRRSSTPIRDSSRKDSQRSKENQKTSSSVKMPSSRERGESKARDRMSSIAKESVAKAKAMLNKRTSGCSSPKKSHRYDRRRSSKHLCLDGLTEWTKTESSHEAGEVRKKERGHEGSERKRKHRLSSSFQKESLRHAKKWKAGSNSDDTGKVDIADENHLDAGGINSCTYEEGHTVLACGFRDSIECTSSKVTVLHTSVSDAYDTTQSDTSFLHASGLQVDNGALKQSTGDAGSHLNKEINKERELSEGEIVSDDEEASRTKKSKPKSSEKKKRRLSKHRHSHSKSPESTTHFLKPPRRGKKHKRRRSSDQEAQERKKRLKENMKSDDSIQSQTEENASVQTSKACEDGLVEELVSENAFPPLTGLNDSEIAPEHPDDDVDKEKDVSEFPETPVDNRPTPTSQSEAVGMMHVSESALGACGVIEEVSKTETLSSPVEEGEHEKDESRGERILKFEDAVESETVGANLSTEALSEQAISTPIKESVCAGEMQARQGVTEADLNVSRGILFEDLCLSSSMDDTSYLSCVNTTSENQRHSFMNSIEKVDDVVKEISDPSVNISALDMDESLKPTEGHDKLETGISESFGTSALDLHHIPPKTITSGPVPDPRKNGEGLSELRVKDASPNQMVTDGTHLERTQKVQDVSTSLSDTSAELNTSKSSEPAHDDVHVLNDDKSESDDHVADEDNDAVSLLAASGYLDSFMHDRAPKVERHVDLSFDESRGVLKETETVDKTETSLHLTCEWSNIEFQDSSTKMGAEPDQGSVTVVAPFFDDGCAQDMKYATNPVLDEEEHEENDDKETEMDIGRTVGNNIKEKEKSQTNMSNEASELRPSKIDPLNIEDMDTSVIDALATEKAVVSKDGDQSCKVKVSGASYSTEEDLFPNRVMDEEKEVEKENLDKGTLADQREGKDEAHVSCNPIVIDDDEVESELDFEEDEEEEEQEDSVYIVDVQPANSCQRKKEQEDDSCQESEEESEELNQSESDTSDLESNHDPLKTCVSRDEPSAVGESEGHDKTISGKGLLESNEVESDLDWGSEPEEQNEEDDVSEDREKGTDKDNKENGKLDKKEEEDEKTDGDQQKCEEDSEEEGEILDEEEGEEEQDQGFDGRHGRKQPNEKSRADQRHRRDHQGHSQSHFHRSVNRDPPVERGKGVPTYVDLM